MRSQLSRFVHSIRVKFRAGNGGDGCISMLHLFANEYAGPSGGNGGNGGHIVLRANPEIRSFNGLSNTYLGKNGQRGEGKCQFGASAPHIFVDVPVGTLVLPGRFVDLSVEPDKSDILAELDEPGSMFIAARGGSGGRGNASYLSNKNRHPRVAEAGAKGEENLYELRMKMFAHVGLIGLPNAGKSSLLHSLTRAQVKIADYAFTTMYPQVGVVEFEDFTQLAIADLPGLIEDSHKNRGLGLRFLRSLEHCACLLYVIDLSYQPITQFETLVNELELHKSGLSRRPHLIWANKIDLIESEANYNSFVQYLETQRPDSKILVGSSKRGDNLEALRLEMRRLRDEFQMKHSDALDQSLEW